MIKDTSRGDRWMRHIRVIRRDQVFYWMMIPGILYYLIFKYIPMYGVIIGFQKYSIGRGIFGSEWVGLQHFYDFFLRTPGALKIIRNTVLLNVYELLFAFPAPIILALLLNELRNVLFKRFVQTISYMPYFLSTVVIVGMVVNFLSPSTGIINNLLKSFFGLEQGIMFMALPEWFRTIYVASEIWQGLGWGTILYLAAIAGINPELYEAADIDGANRWQKMKSITFHGMLPVVIILLILNLGKMMEVGYQKIILMYNPLIYETADVINTFVYRRGLLQADFSFATAIGLFQSVIGFILVLIANRIARKYSETSLW